MKKPSPAAKAETFGTRPNARICFAVGRPKPVITCTVAARLEAMNRANAESVRRAPATVARTTAPTTPTSNVSTTTLCQRRRISDNDSIQIASTSRTARHGYQQTPWNCARLRLAMTPASTDDIAVTRSFRSQGDGGSGPCRGPAREERGDVDEHQRARDGQDEREGGDRRAGRHSEPIGDQVP